MKKKKVFAVFVILFLLLGLIFIVTDSDKNNELVTCDINDYNTELYRIPKTIFPENIPLNAQVVSFVYYDYWHELSDIYLELKFESKEEMEKYLTEVKTACETYCQNKEYKYANECFIHEKNIYNSSYSDLFCPYHTTSQGDEDFTGYRIVKKDEQRMYYECNFGLISYSYDELTIIHTYVNGWYVSDVDEHIPKYFERFNVPLNKESQRIFVLGTNRN